MNFRGAAGGGLAVNDEGFLRKISAKMFHVKHLRALFAGKPLAIIRKMTRGAKDARIGVA
jgi:hypothetical protein